MNEKDKITIIPCKIDEWCDDWPPENVLEFAEWFNKKIGQIPEEYRKTATMEISSSYDFGDALANIKIYYTRSPTDKEIAQMNNRTCVHVLYLLFGA